MCFSFLKTRGKFKFTTDLSNTILFLLAFHVFVASNVLSALGATKIGLLVPHVGGGAGTPPRVNASDGRPVWPVDYKKVVSDVIFRTRTWLDEQNQTGRKWQEFDLVWGDTGKCDEKTVLGETVKMKESSVGIIIGPPCTL
ncbi:hypothetical protein BgiBS90_016053, partial [Biomphalaria glabrata]